MAQSTLWSPKQKIVWHDFGKMSLRWHPAGPKTQMAWNRNPDGMVTEGACTELVGTPGFIYMKNPRLQSIRFEPHPHHPHHPHRHPHPRTAPVPQFLPLASLDSGRTAGCPWQTAGDSRAGRPPG